MREITLYKAEPLFVMGDVQNIIKLKEKIQADEVVFTQIEQDYNLKPEEYKAEFFAAKKNHLRNQYYYHWLVLKKHFEDAWMSEMSLFPDYQKEEMKKLGWMFPQAFINSRITTSGNVDITTEELYARNFDALFDYIFAVTIDSPDSRIDRYYKQAIFNYKNQCYYSCAVSLFPIIESYHQYLTGFNKDEFYKIKENLNKVSEKLGVVKQIYTVKIDYYKKLVEQFNDLIRNHYFKNSVIRKNEPSIINRNRIMHGLFTREISQKDCLQLFCTLSNMVTIKTILNANDRMTQIEKELEQLGE